MSATEKYLNPLYIGDNSAPIGFLDASITDVSTAMTVSGLTSAAPNFRVSIENESVLVTTNVAGVQFITRGQDGTTAVAHAASTPVYPIITAVSLRNNPLAMTTSGDMSYLDASLNQARLPIGSAAGILSSETGIPSWVTATGTGVPVRATSPTLVTPVLGVASGTSLTLTHTSTPLTLVATAFSGNEYLAKLSVSDASTDAAYFSNGTSLDSSYLPQFSGFVGTIATRYSFGVLGMTTAANDASDSSNFGLVDLNALRTDNASNPLAGTLSSIVNRKLFTLRSGVTGAASETKFVIIANGNVGIGPVGGTVSALLHLVKTTEQFRIGYDASNYVSYTVSSVGSLTIAPTGTNPSITLTPAGTGVVNLTRTVLAAGAAAAGAAPLKLTSGTSLTTAEAGALEYNGTNLFFTRAGTTRENVLVAVDNVAAPSTAVGVGIVNYYGAAATNFLGDPNRWLSVNVLGTVYKVPLYN